MENKWDSTINNTAAENNKKNSMIYVTAPRNFFLIIITETDLKQDIMEKNNITNTLKVTIWQDCFPENVQLVIYKLGNYQHIQLNADYQCLWHIDHQNVLTVKRMKNPPF